MKINVSLDTSFLDREAERYQKNLAISTAQALNDTAKEAQSRMRTALRERFHVRKSTIMDRSIKIFAFANVGANRPFAEVGVDNKQRLLLSLFEQGGERGPFVGKNVAVPITGQAARSSIDQSVRPDMTFQSLSFGLGKTGSVARTKTGRVSKKQPGGTGGYRFWQGQQRTFILAHSAKEPLGAVFQRVGPKRDDVRLIYAFKQNVKLKAALDFVATTEKTFNEVFADAFYRRFLRF